MTPEEQEEEIYKCTESPSYFAENYLLINGEKPQWTDRDREYFKQFDEAIKNGWGIRQIKTRLGTKIVFIK